MFEDPEKMIDQCLRNLNEDLAKVKAETAAVMADEQRAKRELDECNAEIAKYQSYAEKAVVAGNDEDAKQFLTKKAQLAEKQVSLQQTYDVAAANSMKMRQMHDKLVKDITELNNRRDAIKAKVRVAKAQERINTMTSSLGNSEASISAFERMEAKADNMLDRANAMAELNTSETTDPHYYRKRSEHGMAMHIRHLTEAYKNARCYDDEDCCNTGRYADA